MFRLGLSLSLMMVCSIANAQLFPNAPWNQKNRTVESMTFEQTEMDCSNGQCATRTPVRDVVSNVVTAPFRMVEAVVSVPRTNYVQEYTPMYSNYTVTSGGGSYGEFAVGKLDPRGHVITSIGVPVLVSPTPAPELPQEVSVLRIGDRAKFKRTLMSSAKLAVENGKITQEQYDALNLAIKFPGVAAKLEAALQETAIENGLATSQAIDWDKLADFIERMVPIILKLIDLFSWKSPQIDTQYAYQSTYDYQIAA